MVLEIDKLMDSDIDKLREIGWLLYNQDLDNGLDKETTYLLIEKLADIEHNISINTEREKDHAYEEGYDEGVTYTKSYYDIED